MPISTIAKKIKRYQADRKKIFATTSLQSHSLPLLHIISQIDNTIPVYFVNTGFHFAATLAFKKKVEKLLGIHIRSIVPTVSKHLQKDANGGFYFTSDPDLCCHINKVEPLRRMSIQYDIWISGVRSDQNANRKRFKEEAITPEGILRYHPMLKWTEKMVWDYIITHKLPQHPLEAEGYLSVGCMPCTRQFSTKGDANGRNGRWKGLNKTECGLHTTLLLK